MRLSFADVLLPSSLLCWRNRVCQERRWSDILPVGGRSLKSLIVFTTTQPKLIVKILFSCCFFLITQCVRISFSFSSLNWRTIGYISKGRIVRYLESEKYIDFLKCSLFLRFCCLRLRSGCTAHQSALLNLNLLEYVTMTFTWRLLVSCSFTSLYRGKGTAIKNNCFVLFCFFPSLKKSSAELKKILANGQVGAWNRVLATCVSRYCVTPQWLAQHKQERDAYCSFSCNVFF